MTPYIVHSRRVILLLIVLCVLLMAHPGFAWADDPLPPIERLTQWGVSAPMPSLDSMRLPEQMPASWYTAALVIPPAEQFPTFPLSPAAFQPVAQWTQFNWPAIQPMLPRAAELPDLSSTWSATQWPSNFAMDPLVRTATAAAYGDARWQAEQPLMLRDMQYAVNSGFEFATTYLALAGGANATWEIAKYTVPKLNEPLGKIVSFVDTAAAVSCADLSSLLSSATSWSLDRTLKSASAQSFSGPFMSSRELYQPISGPGYTGFSQVSVQVTLQPVSAQDLTQPFVFPDTYEEVRTTHFQTSITFSSAPPWAGVDLSRYALPTFTPLTTASFTRFTSPSYSATAWTAPSFSSYTPLPYSAPLWTPATRPYYTMPFVPYTPPSYSIPQITYPSLPPPSWPNW